MDQDEKSMETQFKLQIHLGIIEFDDCMKSSKISFHSFQFFTYLQGFQIGLEAAVYWCR